MANAPTNNAVVDAEQYWCNTFGLDCRTRLRESTLIRNAIKKVFFVCLFTVFLSKDFLPTPSLVFVETLTENFGFIVLHFVVLVCL